MTGRTGELVDSVEQVGSSVDGEPHLWWDAPLRPDCTSRTAHRPEDITVGLFDRFRQPEQVQYRIAYPDPSCPYADIACSEDWMCAGCAPDLLLGHQARPIELAERAREGTNQDGAR